MNKRILIAGLSTLFVSLAAWNYFSIPLQPDWTDEQRQLLASLSLSALPELPADPSNTVADSELAAELGHVLYFDTRLSGKRSV